MKRGRWNKKVLETLACTASTAQTIGGTGSGLPEWTPTRFCVFLSDQESNIWEKSDPVSSEISDLKPCKHAQCNILHTKYADKTDYYGLGIRV